MGWEGVGANYRLRVERELYLNWSWAFVLDWLRWIILDRLGLLVLKCGRWIIDNSLRLMVL